MRAIHHALLKGRRYCPPFPDGLCECERWTYLPKSPHTAGKEKGQEVQLRPGTTSLVLLRSKQFSSFKAGRHFYLDWEPWWWATDPRDKIPHMFRALRSHICLHHNPKNMIRKAFSMASKGGRWESLPTVSLQSGSGLLMRATAQLRGEMGRGVPNQTRDNFPRCGIIIFEKCICLTFGIKFSFSSLTMNMKFTFH